VLTLLCTVMAYDFASSSVADIRLCIRNCNVDSDYRFLSEGLSSADGPVCRSGVSKPRARHTRQLRCDSAETRQLLRPCTDCPRQAAPDVACKKQHITTVDTRTHTGVSRQHVAARAAQEVPAEVLAQWLTQASARHAYKDHIKPTIAISRVRQAARCTPQRFVVSLTESMIMILVSLNQKSTE
jgi:hypothetical protein